MAKIYQGAICGEKGGIHQLVKVYKEVGSWWLEMVGGVQKLAHISVKDKADIPAEVALQFTLTSVQWVK